jgi:hypothetical protein
MKALDLRGILAWLNCRMFLAGALAEGLFRCMPARHAPDEAELGPVAGFNYLSRIFALLPNGPLHGVKIQPPGHASWNPTAGLLPIYRDFD